MNKKARAEARANAVAKKLLCEIAAAVTAAANH
ncbi:hypothetical protein J2T08_005226 [Neorhizobium galegae]|nr:hypothetical protein [Neorhizobium galegae]